MTHTTREAWLQAAVEELRPSYDGLGGTDAKLPDVVRVSCGWAPKHSKNSVGWCVKSTAAADGASHIFVSPEVESPRIVLAILAHELIHAADDCTNGHTGPFKVMHKAIGFEGKPTYSNPGPEMTERLDALAERLGPYPHRSMSPTAREKKQSTRMIKVVCKGGGWAEDDCAGYCARITRKWLDTIGAPCCPACGEQMSEEDQ